MPPSSAQCTEQCYVVIGVKHGKPELKYFVSLKLPTWPHESHGRVEHEVEHLEVVPLQESGVKVGLVQVGVGDVGCHP